MFIYKMRLKMKNGKTFKQNNENLLISQLSIENWEKSKKNEKGIIIANWNKIFLFSHFFFIFCHAIN